jgi:N-acetylmuramoyl-L-alanine amidase CwlA
MAVYHYPVNKQWIAGLPKNPYRNGVGAYEGVVLHYTDNEGDTAQGEANYFAGGGWKNAYVHEFVDATTVIQTADPQYTAWGAGPKANPRFIHIELCSAKSQDEFNKSYDAWCERAAEYLYARKLGVVAAKADGSGTLWSHKNVTEILGGTTHTDPDEHLAKFGKTWDDVVTRVAEIYNALYADEHPQPAAPTVDYSSVPSWALDAVKAGVKKGIITDPNGSNDFYRVVQMMHKLGLFS